MDFWGSRRPYGNKNTPCSIAFQLGWDYKRILVTTDLPAWVQNEAWKLHDLVREKLEKEENNKESTEEQMIWNISVIKPNDNNVVTGYQFQSDTIVGAIKQAERFGTVVKVVLDEYDEH